MATRPHFKPGHCRCPSGREDAEIRVFPIEGRRAGEPDIVVQVYRRHGHDLNAPWGPTGAAVRVPARYAPQLAELLLRRGDGRVTQPRAEVGPFDAYTWRLARQRVEPIGGNRLLRFVLFRHRTEGRVAVVVETLRCGGPGETETMGWDAGILVNEAGDADALFDTAVECCLRGERRRDG